MDKIAKKRSILNKFKENISNVSAITAEKYFQPELLRVMTSLRKCDNDIRSIALGKSIENGDPGEDPIALKLLLKATTSNIARREYMLAVSELSRFHRKLFDINSKLTKFNLDSNKIHYQFLFKDLGQEHLDRLKDLDKKMWKVNAAKQVYLIKYAGITDMIHNVTSKRGRALAAWEKRYPKVIGVLKDKTIEVLNKSNIILNSLDNYFDQFAKFRADRDPNSYEELASSFNKEFAKYDADFRNYYTNTVKPFFDKAKLFEEAEKAEELAQYNNQNQIPSSATPATPASSSPTPSSIPISSKPLGLADTMISSPETLRSKKVEQEVPLSSIDSSDFEKVDEQEVPLSSIDSSKFEKVDSKAASFISTLESLANEDTSILISYIKKFAKKIQDKDPKTAITLLKIISKSK